MGHGFIAVHVPASTEPDEPLGYQPPAHPLHDFAISAVSADASNSHGVSDTLDDVPSLAVRGIGKQVAKMPHEIGTTAHEDQRDIAQS